MLILAIETSTPRSSVCLATEEGLLAGADLNPSGIGARPGGHGEFLAPAIAFCLEHSGLRMQAVSGVAVGLGPGLYTGMRVGIATAATLAHARGLPTVGLASLDVLAFRVRHAKRLLCAAIDARRGELFWAFYRAVHGGVQRVTEFRVGPASKLAGEIEAVREDVLCVGDGAVANRGLLESTGAEVAAAAPTAEALAQLSAMRFVREQGSGPEDLRPIYLRKADARIGWRNRGALFGGTQGPLAPPEPTAGRGQEGQA
jgi:tRNA threonylcarbamoyladenosine biosynthesis protein TsaB